MWAARRESTRRQHSSSTAGATGAVLRETLARGTPRQREGPSLLALDPGRASRCGGLFEWPAWTFQEMRRMVGMHSTAEKCDQQSSPHRSLDRCSHCATDQREPGIRKKIGPLRSMLRRRPNIPGVSPTLRSGSRPCAGPLVFRPERCATVLNSKQQKQVAHGLHGNASAFRGAFPIGCEAPLQNGRQYLVVLRTHRISQALGRTQPALLCVRAEPCRRVALLSAESVRRTRRPGLLGKSWSMASRGTGGP
jgi:hypothetical protein